MHGRLLFYKLKAAAFPVENLHAEAEESLWLKKLPRLTHA